MEVCMNQTPNYQLNQWDKTDRIRMEDFNADNAKIEAALAAAVAAATAANDAATAAQNAVRVATGSYTGDGQANRVIPLPFTPKVLIVLGYYGTSYSDSVISFVTAEGEYSFTPTSGSFTNQIKLSETGFYATVLNWHNVNGRTERYIAFQ